MLVLSAPELDVSSDSSEMVKAIIQTVQNQDKVLKDLYTHLGYDPELYRVPWMFLKCIVLYENSHSAPYVLF